MPKREDFDRIAERLDEVKTLYDLGEADIVCLMQLHTMINLLPFSQELTTKLMRALTSIYEVLLDEKKKKADS